MSSEQSLTYVLTLIGAWLMVFLPLGLIGGLLWGLWRLVPRLRKSMGYRNPGMSSRLNRHPVSK
jgi:hypothetical protein